MATEDSSLTVGQRAAERRLTWLLRVAAGLLLLAGPFAFMPHAWMSAVHEWLGLGTLPELPIIGYLTRSVSALYAFYGLITLWISADVRRYGPLIDLLGLGNILFGGFMLLLDRVVTMPRFWVLIEGPFIITFGAAILLLRRRM
jgi:hypothetical protein